MQPDEFDHEGTPRHDTASLLDHCAASGDCAASGQKVVDHQNLAARAEDGVGVDLQGIGAIFQLVRVRKRLARQFSRLANGISPALSSRASGAAKIKPRASAAAIKSIPI